MGKICGKQCHKVVLNSWGLSNMPIARFQMPDGRIARFEVPEGTTPEAAQQMIGGFDFGNIKNAEALAPAPQPMAQQQAQPQPAALLAPDQTKIGGLMDFGNNIVQNAVGGVRALGDLAFGDFETPLNPQVTPATQALADKLFPQGSEGTFADALKNITQPDLKDYSAALLEKFGANPAGKAVAAVGGLVPAINIAGSAYQTFARPAILKSGIAPENLDAALLVGGGALGAKQLAKGKPALPTKAVAETASQLKKIGVTPEQVVNTMQQAQKQGINLTLPEASAKMGVSPTGAPYASGNTLINRQRVIEQSSTPASDIINQAKAGRAGQITDIISKQGKSIVDAGEAAAKPLYEAANAVKLDKATIKTLLSDPIVKDAVGAFNRDKKLGYKVQDMPKNTVGYFNEVKKYIDAQKQAPSTDRYLGGLYGDATRKITGALDAVAPEYAQARAAAKPAIVARESILEPAQSSDSIGVIKNRIFASPEKRAELQRGIGDKNYKNLSDLVSIIERTQKTASGGSDTFTKAQTANEMANSFGKAANVARGGVFGTLSAAADFIAAKLDEGNYRDLATLYTTENLNALRKELGAAYAKTPDGKVQAVTNFLQNKLPQAVLKAAPSNIAIQEQGRDRTVQTPAVTLPNATQPSTMDVVPFEQLMPEAQPVQALPETKPQSSIEGVIGEAAQMGGANPDLLMAIAETESSLNPNAQAKTSSATGLFQITKDTWRNLVDKYGEQYGVSMRDIRDPRANAIMASLLTRENGAKVSRALGRQISDGEKYIAHFMGAGGAVRLLQADPEKAAYKLFPKEAKANKSIFFAGKTPRTTQEVAQLLSAKVEDKIQQRQLQEQQVPQPEPTPQPAPLPEDTMLANVPLGAIQELRKNPDNAAQFDEVFGNGMAQLALR